MQNRASQYRIEKVTMIKCFLAFLFTVIIAFSSVNVQVLSESESEGRGRGRGRVTRQARFGSNGV